MAERLFTMKVSRKCMQITLQCMREEPAPKGHFCIMIGNNKTVFFVSYDSCYFPNESAPFLALLTFVA